MQTKMARLSKMAIKNALLSGQRVSVRNEHCLCFGGSHEYWLDEDGDVHGYGSGPNWMDQNDELNNAGDIDHHVDQLYKIGNARIIVQFPDF
jgi:hypothetical protein